MIWVKLTAIQSEWENYLSLKTAEDGLRDGRSLGGDSNLREELRIGVFSEKIGKFK